MASPIPSSIASRNELGFIPPLDTDSSYPPFVPIESSSFGGREGAEASSHPQTPVINPGKNAQYS